MKKIDSIIKLMAPSVLMLALILLFSCNEIDGPYTEEGGEDSTSGGSNIRKVLLEEYTGFRCGNCPNATEIAHELKYKYGHNLVLVSIHSGSFADTSKEAHYKYYFPTETGDALYSYFKIASNPIGIISRKEINGSLQLSFGAWGTGATTVFEEKPKMLIRIFPEYNHFTREIYADVEVTYLQAGSSNDYLSVYIVEDSIVNYQKDYRLEDVDIPEYVHENVLRASFNGTWGDRLSETDIAKYQVFRKEYTYTIPEGSDWRPEHLRVIAFVHDNGDSDEVWQVEDKKLIKD